MVLKLTVLRAALSRSSEIEAHAIIPSGTVLTIAAHGKQVKTKDHDHGEVRSVPIDIEKIHTRFANLRQIAVMASVGMNFLATINAATSFTCNSWCLNFAIIIPAGFGVFGFDAFSFFGLLWLKLPYLQSISEKNSGYQV